MKKKKQHHMAMVQSHLTLSYFILHVFMHIKVRSQVVHDASGRSKVCHETYLIHVADFRTLHRVASNLARLVVPTAFHSGDQVRIHGCTQPRLISSHISKSPSFTHFSNWGLSPPIDGH